MARLNPMLAVCTILLETLFLAVINIEICIIQDIDYLKVFLPFANAAVLVFSGLALFSIKQIEENSRKKVESCLLGEYLQNVEDLINSIHAQRHEHTRHIQTLQAMLYLEEADRAREYLDGIAENYQGVQDLIYVGDPALTALLNSKRKVAETKNIHFDFAVKCDVSNIGIAPWDLCSIVGNLLDNALEAAVHDKKNRQASLEIKYENSHYMIYVYNNGAKIPSSQIENLFKPGYTNKNSAARGFGLYLVKKLVDKYGGSIKVICEPRTAFIVSLPDRSEKKGDQKAISQVSKSFREAAASQ
ncbi:MAG: GHKL domain-containing protein [Syntrophomonadaceae bacterium]|nr:GHKL domain-containing protein [Syntrophomonadaceae bacterium]